MERADWNQKDEASAAGGLIAIEGGERGIQFPINAPGANGRGGCVGGVRSQGQSPKPGSLGLGIVQGHIGFHRLGWRCGCCGSGSFSHGHAPEGV
jgi:hypothetical protein